MKRKKLLNHRPVLIAIVLCHFLVSTNVEAKDFLTDSVVKVNELIDAYESGVTSVTPCSQPGTIDETQWLENGFVDPVANIYPLSSPQARGLPQVTHHMPLEVVHLRGSQWSVANIVERYSDVREIYRQCGIDVTQIRIVEVDAPVTIDRKAHKRMMTENLKRNPNADPTQIFTSSNLISEYDYTVGDLEQESHLELSERVPTQDHFVLIHVNNVNGTSSSGPEFAYGGTARLNRHWLEHDITTRHTDNPKYKNHNNYSVEAHELAHTLLNESHNNVTGNIMDANNETRTNSMTPEQCEKMKNHPMLNP